VRALPGVEAVATTCCVPLEDRFAGRLPHCGTSEVRLAADSRGRTLVSRLLRNLQNSVLRGHVYRAGRSAPPVVIINQTLASGSGRR